MSVDAKCYECVAGAGLEPILSPSFSGGRGQASGFIMRMMAENKKKHQGQYRNPSNNDYGSTMNQFRAFDYKKLANEDQNGNNQSEYGASPFIQKHFGSPEAVQFIPKAQRGSEEHRVIEGETEEQKAARLQAKAEQLAELARELLEKSSAKGKIKGFIKGKIAVKKAKELLQQKKKEKAEEDERKAKELSKEQLIKAAEENAKVLEAEWKADENAIFDYLSYANKGTDSYFLKTKLRDLWEKWCKEKQYEKFGEALRPILSGYYYGREEVKKRIIPRPDSYYLPRNRGYNYKKVSYAEAKRVYDKYFPPEEQAPEEKTKRQLALKGVIRRIIRTKQTLKSQAQTLPLPKWWDGVMCVLAWAKGTEYPSGPKDLYSQSWFGKTLYYAGNHRDSPFFIEDYEELPPEPKGKSKKAEEARVEYNRIARKRNEQYKLVGDALLKVASQYAKWLFTIALPTKGYNLVEYHPTEATFPQEEVIETRMVGGPTAYGQQGYTYHKTGRFRPSGTRFLIGTNREGYNPERDSVPPLPDVLTLLLHPDGKLAWLISSKSGDARWEGLGKMMLGDRTAGDTGFSFHTKFRKVGDQFIHIVKEPIDGSKYGSEVPQKVGDLEIKEVLNSQTLLGNNPPVGSRNHITWAYKEGIAQITKNLFDDLCERKEWSGKPLVKIDLTGSGRRKRC